jgi:hypothetical protein
MKFTTFNNIERNSILNKILFKIGFYKFSILKHESDKTRKFSIDELKEIIKEYKQKIKSK